MNSAIGRIHLWRSISPALPIGAYAYSQGLEFACEQGWVYDANSSHDWIAGIMTHSIAKLDIPLLARLIDAWQRRDQSQLHYWNQLLLASRESKELRDEDEHLGSAFTRIIKEEDIQLWKIWSQTEKPCYATIYALFVTHWQIELFEACCGYVWSWCENQVGAAIKLIPLGQSAGQQILSKLINHIPPVIELGLQLNDEEIGSLLPGLGISSALHETQYTRLFRS